MGRRASESAAGNLIPKTDYPKTGFISAVELCLPQKERAVMGADALSIENSGISDGQYYKGQRAWGHRAERVAAAVIATLILASPAFAQSFGKKANWKTLEADNGAIYKIDLNSISHYHNGTADMIVYAVEGSGYNPENMHRLWFDCHGNFRDETGPRFGETEYAPPRSMAGRISEIACAGARETPTEQLARPTPKDTLANYCLGFSPGACARIIAAAEAKSKPSYCRPGYELVGSGLSPEQIRICQVIAYEDFLLAHSPINRIDSDAATKSYEIKLSASADKFPNIIGSTNLPDGTKLLISINKPRLPNARELLAAGLPMCQDNCIPASGPKGEMLGVSSVVLAGAFSAGPFSWAGKPFWQGTFEVDVFLVSLPGEGALSLATVDRQLERMKNPILTAPVTVSPQ